MIVKNKSLFSFSFYNKFHVWCGGTTRKPRLDHWIVHRFEERVTTFFLSINYHFYHLYNIQWSKLGSVTELARNNNLHGRNCNKVNPDDFKTDTEQKCSNNSVLVTALKEHTDGLKRQFRANHFIIESLFVDLKYHSHNTSVSSGNQIFVKKTPKNIDLVNKSRSRWFI